MAVYNSEIAAAQLSAAMQQPAVVNEIFQLATNNSIAMTKARRLPNMATATARMSVLNLLPIAYFQATGTTLKQTTKAAWVGKTITAEELAVIVPISENVLADAVNIDIWGEIKPLVAEAMGLAIDAAVFHGTNLPATWLTDSGGTSKSLVAGATAASTTIAEGTNLDLYDDIFGEDGVISLVEQQGFIVDGHAAAPSLAGKLRGLRSGNETYGAGMPVLGTDGSLGGIPITYARNGAIDAASALLISGDWRQLVYSVRQDITATLANQGVVQNADGDIQYNLFQQDMVAMRFVFRLGFQIANPVTQLSSTEATRYPFAILTPAAS